MPIFTYNGKNYRAYPVFIVHSMKRLSLPAFTPGEVLALLSPLQEMEAGLYLLASVNDEWATLRGVFDDEAGERVLVLESQYRLPVRLLLLFMPIGLRLEVPPPEPDWSELPMH